MNSVQTIQKKEPHRRSFFISLVLHLLVLLILFVPFIRPSTFPSEHIIMVEFFDDAPSKMSGAEESDDVLENKESSSTPVANTPASSSVLDDVAPIKTPTTKPKDPSPKTTIDEAKKKEEQERLAAEKARKEKEAADKAAESQKNKFKDLFGKGGGNNSGDGKNDGDPDGSSLDGITKGTGTVGGGLNGRSVIFAPKITDNTQKTGKVAIDICVDKIGNVTKAEFTQRGSTTSNTTLIDIARRSAFKYKFSASEIESQCGTIIIDFKLE